MKKTVAFLLLCCALNTSLYSAIESVTIRWTAMLCPDSCVTLLEREFRKIKGVDQFSIDQGSGQVVLTWKPKEYFQYSSLNMAMRMVGLSMRSIRIRASGKITHTGNRFFIVSDGDNTRFELLNPIVSQPRGVTAEFNEAARQIGPLLQQKLLEAERTRAIATIEGPVFMPERNTVPTQIVVDHFDVREEN